MRAAIAPINVPPKKPAAILLFARELIRLRTISSLAAVEINLPAPLIAPRDQCAGGVAVLAGAALFATGAVVVAGAAETGAGGESVGLVMSVSIAELAFDLKRPIAHKRSVSN